MLDDVRVGGDNRGWLHANGLNDLEAALKIAITGAAGFIGMSTAMAFMRAGHELVCLDARTNPNSEPRLVELGRQGIGVHRATLGDFTTVKSLGNAFEGVNAILHFAAQANVVDSIRRPQSFIHSNISGTQEVIDIARKFDVQMVVYASSSTVCTGPLPWNEDSVNLDGFENPYALSKYVNEVQFRSSGIAKTVGLRFFSVFGPWGRPDMMPLTFLNRILDGEPLHFNVDERNASKLKRDFLYIDDAISAIFVVLECTAPGHEVYNVGMGRSTEITVFADELMRAAGKDVPKIFLQRIDTEALATWCDPRKLTGLGWRPETDFKDGIGKLVEWRTGLN